MAVCLLSANVYADPALDKAALLLKSGRAVAAESIYQAYLQTHPNQVEAQLALANLAIRRFDYPQARAILEKSLAQHPDSAAVAATLGHLFQLWGSTPYSQIADATRNYSALAQEHFQQAASLGANNPLVLTYLAEWQLQQNDLISAEKNLQKAIAIQPDYIPAFQGFTRLYIKTRDLQRAKDSILHAMELDPENSTNYFLTAQMLALANRPAEAVQYAERSEQLDYGRLPERDYFLASQYDKLGSTLKAIQYYELVSGYNPKDAQIWLKLGDLYDSQKQSTKSLTAYRTALALNPDILSDLYAKARNNSRTEKIELALSQWRRLLSIQPDRAETVQEGLGAIAGLHYLKYYLNHQQANPAAQQDMPLFEALHPLLPGDSWQLDVTKLRLASQGGLNPGTEATLRQLSHSASLEIAGEAAFLLGDYAQCNKALEQADSISDFDTVRLADRLLLIQELSFAKVFYQRAYQFTHDAKLEAAMKRIQAKQALAEQRVNEGNLAFNAKQYKDATAKYTEAVYIYPEWDNAYLRLGDTYERLNEWKSAKQSYDKAISLTPSLMSSEGFAKHYAKLTKKAAKQ